MAATELDKAIATAQQIKEALKKKKTRGKKL